MKIVKREGLFEATTELDYEPTPAELFFWYGGTSGRPDPRNPYAPKRTRITRTIYRKVSP